MDAFFNEQKKIEHGSPSQWVIFVLLIIPVALAAFFRFQHSHSLPPGLSNDEAAFGLGALHILRGNFFQVSHHGTLISYVQVPFILALGRTPFALRLPGILAGIGTTWALMRFIFAGYRHWGTAFWAGTIYAITLTFVHFSRLAFPSALLPLVQVLIYLFFWRAWQYRRLRDFFISGLLTGIIIHTYVATLALPLAMGIVWMVFGWHERPQFDTSRFALTSRRLQKWLLPAILYWAGFMIFALPYFTGVVLKGVLFHSDRFTDVFIFNPAVNQGRLLEMFLHQIWVYAGMYGWLGDPIWRHNIPGRPLFDPVMAFFFLLGLLTSIRRIRRPINQFLLIHYFVLLLPAFLSYAPDGPIWTHISPIFVLSAIFAALGFTRWVNFFRRKSVSLASIAVGGLLILLVVESALSYHDYFHVWANGVRPTMSFDELFVSTAEELNELTRPPDIWIIPKAAREHNQLRPRSFEFLYTARTPVYFVPADEQTAPPELARLTTHFTRVGHVGWSDEALVWAAPVYYDAQGLIHFLLQKNGARHTLLEQEGVTLAIFELGDHPDFSLPASPAPIPWTFDGRVQLVDFASAMLLYPASDNAGDGWAGGHWMVVQEHPRKEKLTLRVLDAQGYQLSQIDRMLVDDRNAPTSQWTPLSPAWNHVFFLLPAGTPPGDYPVTAGLYDAETMALAPVTAGERWSARMAQLGTLKVDKIVRPHQVKPQILYPDGDTTSARFLGYDPIPSRAHPGDLLKLPLAWRARTTWHRPSQIVLRLVKKGANAPVQEATEPFASFAEKIPWQKGEAFQQNYSFRLMRNLSDGEYGIQVALHDPMTQTIERWFDLSSIQIVSWARQFTSPKVQRRGSAIFDGKISLYGYEVTPKAPDSSLSVTLCWKALTEMDVSYKLFLQLLDNQNRVVAQTDTIPGTGSQPTTAWQEGEFICNDFVLTWEQRLAPGDYTLITGFYDPRYEERLPVALGSERDDKVILTSFSVSGQ